jgi:ERCC4-type nuclease
MGEGCRDWNKMKISIDSREQSYLEFPFEFVTEVKREKLIVGDYQAEYANGYRPPLIFERKSINDLYGTLGKGYKRFKKEIIRAKENNIRLVIVIEGSMPKVAKGIKMSDMSGESIIRRLFTLFIKYDVYVVFCNTREEMASYIYETYCAIGRLLKKEKHG